jgi:hypothetical protein
MGKMPRLIKWLWRAWPIFITLAIIGIHLLLLTYYPQNKGDIHKIFVFLTQIVGGGLIIYTIDSNIGVFKQKSLCTLLSNYFSEFPLNNRSITSVISCSEGSADSCGLIAKIIQNPQGIDEKIRYLQDQINEIKGDLKKVDKELNEKIAHQSKEMDVQIQEARSALQSLESKMDKVSSGSVTDQLFGVMLMVYSAIVSYVIA